LVFQGNGIVPSDDGAQASKHVADTHQNVRNRYRVFIGSKKSVSFRTECPE